MSDEKHVDDGIDNTSPFAAATLVSRQDSSRVQCIMEKLYVKDLEAGHAEEDHSSSSSVSDADEDGDSVSYGGHMRDGASRRDTRSPMARMSATLSVGADNPVETYASFAEVPDSVYDRFSHRRKVVVVVLLSYCSFLASTSSTAVLSATPEVAAEFRTTGSIVNTTNALYLFCMGISTTFWGRISEVWGRKITICSAAALFTASSIGTAVSPNLAAFFAFRILTAFEGMAFLLVGAACVQDIYHPTERGTAMGSFMSGTLVGPAIGPFIGGIIITFTSWRVIFWLQTGLAGLATLGALFLLPETIHHKKCDDLVDLSRKRKAVVLCKMVNPGRIVKLMFTYPNLILTGLASSSLVWNMYAILTPIRYVLNPRFHLTTPMQSGFFYLAPGMGYLMGTFFGGRYADYVVKKYMTKRRRRVPEDRLRSALPFLGAAVPACVLVYGWCVDRDVGGVPVVVVSLFLQGLSQLLCFPSLNTYCLDVMQGRGSDVIAGNYFLRYLFSCFGTAVVLPAVESVGVGWFSTASAAFMVLAAVGTWATIIWGERWRERVDEKQRARRNGG